MYTYRTIFHSEIAQVHEDLQNLLSLLLPGQQVFWEWAVSLHIYSSNNSQVNPNIRPLTDSAAMQYRDP